MLMELRGQHKGRNTGFHNGGPMRVVGMAGSYRPPEKGNHRNVCKDWGSQPPPRGRVKMEPFVFLAFFPSFIAFSVFTLRPNPCDQSLCFCWVFLVL